MKKTWIQGWIDAETRFNLHKLIDFLIRTKDGTVIVDRTSLLQTKDDIRLFYNVMHSRYRWDYRFPSTSTIYFKIKNGQVVGGIYERDIGLRSQSVIAVPREQAKLFHYDVYSYDQQVINNIIKRIETVK